MEHYEIRKELNTALWHLMNAETVAKATGTPRIQAATSKLVSDAFEILNSLRG